MDWVDVVDARGDGESREGETDTCCVIDRVADTRVRAIDWVCITVLVGEELSVGVGVGGGVMVRVRVRVTVGGGVMVIVSVMRTVCVALLLCAGVRVDVGVGVGGGVIVWLTVDVISDVLEGVGTGVLEPVRVTVVDRDGVASCVGVGVGGGVIVDVTDDVFVTVCVGSNVSVLVGASDSVRVLSCDCVSGVRLYEIDTLLELVGTGVRVGVRVGGGGTDSVMVSDRDIDTGSVVVAVRELDDDICALKEAVAMSDSECVDATVAVGCVDAVAVTSGVATCVREGDGTCEAVPVGIHDTDDDWTVETDKRLFRVVVGIIVELGVPVAIGGIVAVAVGVDCCDSEGESVTDSLTSVRDLDAEDSSE